MPWAKPMRVCSSAEFEPKEEVTWDSTRLG
jgi:hypothetical protein